MARADDCRDNESRRAADAALSTISDLIYIFDERHCLVYGNQAFFDLIGAVPNDLVGRPIRSFLGDALLADQLEADMQRVVDIGETVFNVARYTSPSGISGHFEYIYRPYVHDGGVWIVGSSRDVSERIRLTEEVSQKTRQLSEMLESITDSFYAVDRDWNFTFVNTQAADVLQRDRDELIGRSIWDEFPETTNTILYPSYLSAMETQTHCSFDFHYAPLDTWFEVHVYPSPDNLSVYFRDINEKVRIQHDLAANERRYRTLTDAMPQMVWLTDANGYHLYYNRRWYEYTGLSENESLGFGFTNALHPDDKVRTLERWERAWRFGEDYEIEYRFYSKDSGEYRWFLGRAFRVYDDDGSVVEWVGTCTDIDPQKRAEAKLQESERRLADAQRIARIGNWEFDINTETFTSSAEHDRIFGLDPQEEYGIQVYINAIPEDDRALVRQQRDRVLEQGFGSYDIEYRIVRADGEERVVHTLAELETDDAGRPIRFVGTVHDVTERREIERAVEEYAHQQSVLSRDLQQLNATLEQQVQARTAELRRLSENLERMVQERTAELEESRAELAFQAQHDPLTQLPNRTLLEDRLERAIASAERNGLMVGVLFIDLDGFKLINDTFGHAAGDEILKAVGSRLQARLRRSDTLARHGGDEFAAVVAGISGPDALHTVSQALLSCLSTPMVVSGRSVRMSASIGAAVYPQDALTVSALQRNADIAMYRAKLAGKNDIRFYSPSMNAAAEERLEIATHLSSALDNAELKVHYQPQVDARSGRIVSFEALLRWNNPVLGSVAPGRLIPIAEEAGLMIEIGNWVLEQSCAQAASLSSACGEKIGIAVNLSAAQLDREDFICYVEETLDRHQLDPWQLELEVTEKAVVHDLEYSSRRMNELRALGVRFALDGFGLGTSSLGNLVRLPLDTVKIDREFIRDLPGSGVADRVVQAIVSLAHGIDLCVVGEGIETVAQRDRVLALGCGRLQGFLLGYPVDAATAEKLLRDQRTPPR